MLNLFTQGLTKVPYPAESEAHHFAPGASPAAHLANALRAFDIDPNISGNSVISSVLPTLPTPSRAASDSAYVGHELVPLTTLDLVVPDYLDAARAPFLRIDAQGYEWFVLDGAVETLPAMRGILIELSLVPFYEGQRLWQECVDSLEAEGFLLWALQSVFVDPANGRSLQPDRLFIRP